MRRWKFSKDISKKEAHLVPFYMDVWKFMIRAQETQKVDLITLKQEWLSYMDSEHKDEDFKGFSI